MNFTKHGLSFCWNKNILGDGIKSLEVNPCPGTLLKIFEAEVLEENEIIPNLTPRNNRSNKNEFVFVSSFYSNYRYLPKLNIVV